MLNLMKIEFKKNKMKNDIFGVILANVGIFILSVSTAFLVGFHQISEDTAKYYHIDQIVQLTTVIFAVYGAILICNLIVDEFKEGTINGLFLYPKSRERIILSKIFTVLAFVIISAVITLIIQLILFVATNNIFNFYIDLDYGYLVKRPLVFIIALASVVGFTLIATFIAYKSKSSIITVLITLLLSGKAYSGSFGNNIISYFLVSIIILIIGIITTIYVIKDIKNIDIE